MAQGPGKRCMDCLYWFSPEELQERAKELAKVYLPDEKEKEALLLEIKTRDETFFAKGQCRRYPPSDINGFSETVRIDWCGEWERK